MLDSVNRAARVNQVFTDLNRKYEEEETQKKATSVNIAYINLFGYPVDTQALGMISQTEAETFGTVVFYREGKNLKIGAVEKKDQIQEIARRFQDQGFDVQLFLISKSSFNHFFANYDKVVPTKVHSDVINLKSSDSRFRGSLKNLNEHLRQTSATELVEELLGTALQVNASDVHVEPEKNDLKIRFRIDGVLQDAATVNLSVHQTLISRIKILSKLKLNVLTAPQDGSYSLTYEGQQVDVRVSVLPSAFGESTVMRLLRQDKDSLKFEDLGIGGLAQQRILEQMQKPNGMILATGPTGSGKTTTLYAILNQLNEPGVKIVTLEDPVEYKIEGITQTPIDARAGMTFADALRAILRQDPDIVMVGEMRDLETAETAAQAALTGHVVLSTLHTNDAPAAIPRLLDLGIKPFVLAPAINAIVAQRLVRKLCEKCKQPYELSVTMYQRVELLLKTIPASAKAPIPKKLIFYHSTGCVQCHGLGYRGRIGVYEVFTISEAIEKLITKNATTSEIKKLAIAEGMITMAQDGILKVLQGITDVEEVFRVTEE